MGLIRYCLRNGVAVAVVMAIVMLIGIISVTQLPLQLFPNIAQPQMSVQTFWRAADPEQMERVIVEEQEAVLRGMPGLQELRADINPNFVNISLTFDIATDMDQAMVEVISRLNRLPPLPADANPPVVQSSATGDSNDTLIYLFIQSLPGNELPIMEQAQFLVDNVVPRFESIDGVASAQIQGPGTAPEVLEITFDPFLLAQYGIQIPQIAAVAGRSQDVTAGFVDIGRRSYTVSFDGEFTPAQMEEQILDWRDGRPVRLGDVAEVAVKRADRFAIVYQNGHPAIGLRIFRSNGANVLSTIDAVKETLAELNEGVMAERGLAIAQSYDPSVFIKRAINLLTTNLALGIALAVGALWLFLRNTRATLIIGMTIPISLLVTFTVLQMTGRSLNVISLAGLAFAVGMVLDGAIVVLESIVRQRENGLDNEEASVVGASRVWNALVASTATTVAVFLPVMFLKDAEGQLFADLALTIAIAVTASLLVAVMVLPTVAAHYMPNRHKKGGSRKFWSGLAGVLMAMTGTGMARRMWVVLLIVVPIIASAVMAPPLGYLPTVRRDAIDAGFSLPPGANLDTVDEEIIRPMVERLQPYMDGTLEPALLNYYVFSFPGGGSLGVRPLDMANIDELGRLVNEEILAGFPDTFGGGRQGDLFGGFGNNGGIVLNVQASDPDTLMAAGQAGIDALRIALPDAQINPPAIRGNSQPVLSIIPNDRRISEAGWDRNQVSSIIRALGDGLYMGDYFDGTNSIDILLKTQEWGSPEALGSIPLATPSGSIVPLGDLVDIQQTLGPRGITRIDGRRTVSIFVAPPEGMALQNVIEIIEAEVEPAIRAALGADGALQYGGSAGSLERVLNSMGPNLLFAVGVLFLLMAGMFRSVKDSVLVLLILGPACFGGVIGLVVLNMFTTQELDLLTMIGFIILMGIVVNNAILLVHRTRQSQTDGMSRKDAVRDALEVRLRPIFMTTMTTIMGMLPLVLIPGPGSVIYRGLAATIVGGMSVSTLFTLILLPALLRMGEDAVVNSKTKKQKFSGGALPAAGE